jgi:hypothetical protein
MKNTSLRDVALCSLVHMYQVTRRHIPHISAIMRLQIVDFHENGLMCMYRTRFVK